MSTALESLRQAVTRLPEIDFVEIPEAKGVLESAKSQLDLRLATHTPKRVDDDRLLTVEEASTTLGGISEDTLYRKNWPFKIHVGARVLFSHSGIQDFIRKRKGN